jgi:hypothetical protein
MPNITTHSQPAKASVSRPDFGNELPEPALTYDNGGRRRLADRRQFTHLPHFPERRSLRFRRSDVDRRQNLHGTSPTGFERRRMVARYSPAGPSDPEGRRLSLI